MKHTPLIALAITLPLILIAGCSSSDSQLAYFAERSADRQAEQNKRMADVTQAASQDHRRIVEAVETSRQEVVSLEHEVREQHDRLDEERRGLAAQRNRELMLVPVLETIGMLLVAALPLVVCIYLLRGLQTPEDEASETLLRELVERPGLLTSGEPRPRLEARQRRIESPEGEEAELPF